MKLPIALAPDLVIPSLPASANTFIDSAAIAALTDLVSDVPDLNAFSNACADISGHLVLILLYILAAATSVAEPRNALGNTGILGNIAVPTSLINAAVNIHLSSPVDNPGAKPLSSKLLIVSTLFSAASSKDKGNTAAVLTPSSLTPLSTAGITLLPRLIARVAGVHVFGSNNLKPDNDAAFSPAKIDLEPNPRPLDKAPLAKDKPLPIPPPTIADSANKPEVSANILLILKIWSFNDPGFSIALLYLN